MPPIQFKEKLRKPLTKQETRLKNSRKKEKMPTTLPPGKLRKPLTKQETRLKKPNKKSKKELTL